VTRHLLDTDVCIAVLRGRDRSAEARLRALGSVAVSSVTAAELAYGTARSRDPASNQGEVERFLGAVHLVDLDLLSAQHAGEIRATLAARGTPIGGYDVLIAGVARAHDLTLVTGNVREFERVEGLTIEPW
jgi:tRNA(fMet)-specific endonuclease VapC